MKDERCVHVPLGQIAEGIDQGKGQEGGGVLGHLVDKDDLIKYQLVISYGLLVRFFYLSTLPYLISLSTRSPPGVRRERMKPRMNRGIGMSPKCSLLEESIQWYLDDQRTISYRGVCVCVRV